MLAKASSESNYCKLLLMFQVLHHHSSLFPVPLAIVESRNLEGHVRVSSPQRQVSQAGHVHTARRAGNLLLCQGTPLMKGFFSSWFVDADPNMPNIQLVAIHCDSGPSSLWRPGSLVAAFFTNVPWENRGARGDFTLSPGRIWHHWRWSRPNRRRWS